MTRGKQTCRILKEIRRQIAEANDIEFITSECRYKGDCLGTCPKCDAEVRYLEQQLRARSLAGKAVVLAGISAGMIFVSGCSGTSSNQSNETLQGEPVVPVEQNEITDSIGDESLEDTLQKEETPKLHIIKVTELAICGDPEVLKEMESEEVVEDSIYDFPHQPPSFPGGHAAMLKFICDHIKYPDSIGDLSGSDRIVARCIVDKTGRVVEPKIVEGDFLLSAEVLRIINRFPLFVPGKINNQPVNCNFVFPIYIHQIYGMRKEGI